MVYHIRLYTYNCSIDDALNGTKSSSCLWSMWYNSDTYSVYFKAWIALFFLGQILQIFVLVKWRKDRFDQAFAQQSRLWTWIFLMILWLMAIFTLFLIVVISNAHLTISIGLTTEIYKFYWFFHCIIIYVHCFMISQLIINAYCSPWQKIQKISFGLIQEYIV